MQSALRIIPPGERRDNPPLAIVSVCAAVALATTLDAAVKWLSGDYPVHQLMVLRCIAAAPVLYVVLRLQGSTVALLHPHWPVILARGLVMCSAYLAFTLAIAAMPIADAVAIYFTMPMIIAALAGPALGERVSLDRWMAIVAGFLGVVVMIRPGAAVFEPAALLAVYGAFSYAVGQLMTRWLGFGIEPALLSYYQNAIYLAVGGMMAVILGLGHFAADVHPSLGFLLRGWTMPPAPDLALMLAIGVISAIAMVLFTQAYRQAQANLVAPFEYTGLFWATLYGVLLFGDVPDLATGLGAALVVGGGLYMLRAGRRVPADRPSAEC